MSKDLELAIQTAKQAGQIIRDAYTEKKKIKKKNSNDFVTDTDIKAEKFIKRQLSRTGYSFFGEETGEEIKKNKKKWVVDPIDGTNNFIRGYPFFAISIALIKDNKELILGVIYDPIANECYWAEKNKGAFMNNVKIVTSKKNNLESAVFLMDHGSLEKDKVTFLQCLNQITLDKGPSVLRQECFLIGKCPLK